MGGKLLLWWGAILVIAWVAAVVGERLARPLLPLASLLKMSLLFPDMAPSRFAVAWRSGSTRQLARYVDGLDHSHHREPVTAAAEILTLVTALSSHDRRTRGHSERVRAYTDLLAEELRLPQADRDRLRWSALLHDVGKISVDVDILNKTGAPSEAEWEVLHQHPIEGKRMIEPLHEWLGQWGLAVEQHHENFDGTGYPFGISGDAISLGARIVAVADAFEVMTAARSYKSAMSPSAARKELTRCAGTQFDPAIVRAFLNISVGRQRWVIGPLAWLFDVPIVSQLSNLGNVITVGSQVAIVAGSVTLGAAAAGGQVLTHPHPLPSTSLTTTTLVHHSVVSLTETAIGLDVTSNTVVVGGDVRASAKILGTVSDLTGTVTYDVFDNGACSSANGGLVASFGPLAVANGRLPASPDWVATVPTGTYYFVATYSGDASHRAAVSGCSAVPVTLKSAATVSTPTTTVPPATTASPPTTASTTTTDPPPATTSTTTTTTTLKSPPTTTTTLKPPPTTTTTSPPTTTTTLKSPPTTTTTLKSPPTTTTTLKLPPTTTTTSPPTTTTTSPPTTTTTSPPTTPTTFPACKWWNTQGCQNHSLPNVERRKVN